MTYQIPFAIKNSKNIISLSSADFAHSTVSLRGYCAKRQRFSSYLQRLHKCVHLGTKKTG